MQGNHDLCESVRPVGDASHIVDKDSGAFKLTSWGAGGPLQLSNEVPVGSSIVESGRKQVSCEQLACTGTALTWPTRGKCTSNRAATCLLRMRVLLLRCM